MPIQEETPFSSYKFTPDEMERARELSPEQRCYLQTLLSDAAQEKLAITFDPYKPKLFLQTEAYLRGQIDILNMMLSTQTIKRPRNAVTPSDASTVNPQPKDL